MKTDIKESEKEKAISSLNAWVFISVFLALWFAFLAFTDFLTYTQDSSIGLSSALMNLTLAILLLISMILLWKRNLFVLLFFGLFTLATVISPLFMGLAGYQMIDLLLLLYPAAVFYSIYGYWKQGLFS
jgi:hypothetical protein